MSSYLDALWAFFQAATGNGISDIFANGMMYLVSSILGFFSWLFLDPAAWIKAGTKMVTAIVDIATWALPDVADSYLVAFKAAITGPLMLAVTRIALYLISQVYNLTAFNACIVAHFVAFPMFLTIRSVRYLITTLWGGGSN